MKTDSNDIRDWLVRKSIHMKQCKIFVIEPYLLKNLFDLASAYQARIHTDLKLIRSIHLENTRDIDLRDYQQKAIEILINNNYRGIIILPTGAGKSRIALKIISMLNVRTLLVVPTIDLLNQWKDKIKSVLGVSEEKIGIYGGGLKEVRDITIITYQSASKPGFLQRYMDEFSLLILDEAHHVLGERFMEIPRRLIAPYRIGLTATLDTSDEESKLLKELIGEMIYLDEIDKLVMKGYLAKYDYELIRIKLTETEARKYRALIKTYTDYLRSEGIREKGRKAYLEVLRRAKSDYLAKKALISLKQARDLAFFNKNKLITLNKLLLRHRRDKVIIFTRHVLTAGKISYIFRIPKIASDTPKELRAKILMAFKENKITKIVTAEALDEGVDIPDASVCIIISGRQSKRQFIQRIGRVLRPKRNKKAMIYELVTAKTLEEKVHKKRHL